MAYAPPPDVVALVRRRYAEGAAVTAIVAESGIKNRDIVYRCIAGRYPDGSGVQPAPIPLRRPGVRHRKGSRAALVARMWRTAERQVEEIEDRLRVAGLDLAERESNARTLAVVAKTLRELVSVDDAKQPRGREDNDDDAPYGVNSGIGRSGKVLRRVLGMPDNTAAVTEEVLRAVAERDPRALIAAINDERLAFLKSLRTWPVFGVGWGRRVAQVRAAALQMADVTAKTVTPVPGAKSPGKGQVPISAKAQKGTAGGIVVAGAAAAQQAHHGGGRPVIVAGIVIVTIVLALGGWFAWRWHQRRRQLAQID